MGKEGGGGGSGGSGGGGGGSAAFLYGFIALIYIGLFAVRPHNHKSKSTVLKIPGHDLVYDPA